MKKGSSALGNRSCKLRESLPASPLPFRHLDQSPSKVRTVVAVMAMDDQAGSSSLQMLWFLQLGLPSSARCFFASVAKHHPHCVSKIYTPKDYAPIVISGIVSSNAASITTELEVGFLFHLPRV